jgi:uncharacterized peroxidase-related enzyme
MFLQDPPGSEAGAALYASDEQQMGFLMNLTRLWAWRPDVYESFGAMRSQLMAGSTLSQRELGVIVCTSAATLGDSYCALAWGKKLANAADAGIAAAVLRGELDDGLNARERALLSWVGKMCRDPNATTPADVDSLRSAGFTEREIFELTAFAAIRTAFSMVNDALGVQPDCQVQQAAPPEVQAAITFGRPSAAK